MENHSAMLQIAARMGEHAVPLFFAAWGLLLVAAGCGARLLRCLPHPAASAGMPSPQRLLLRLAAGLAAIIAFASLFAEIAAHLRGAPTLGLADEAFMAALAIHPPQEGLLFGFYVLTFLGNRSTQWLVAIVVAVGLGWRRHRMLALGWTLAMAGNGLLNPALKRVFERVRPAHPTAWLTEEGFSFPSGHSSGAVVALGMLAYLAARLLPQRFHVPLLWVAVSLAFSIGVSRIFLRVHYPSDVLAGFASGAAWLLVCIVSLELSCWYRRGGEIRRAGG